MNVPVYRRRVFFPLTLVLLLMAGVLALFLSQTLSAGASNPLRTHAAARNRFIGAAVDYNAFQNDATYKTVLAREFNMLTPENVMKWDTIHPQQNSYNFAPADDLVNFAQQNSMEVRGHALVWHQQNPDWVNGSNFSRDQALSVLENHITTVATHYKGKVKYWDVVNEAVSDSGGLRGTVWKNAIGDDYIDKSFQWAHAADPDAKLFYNDYSGEGLSSKSDEIYNLVKGMKERGIPIHGIGLQMHLYLQYHTEWKAQILSNMQRLAALGLEVQITEMDIVTQDVPYSDAEKLQQSARLYGDIMNNCLEVSACTAFVMWGFTDKYSWIYNYIGPNNMPLIYDRDYQPKPAYHTLHDILAGGGTSPTPTPTLPPPAGTNLALNKPATASSVENNDSAYSASSAFDGNNSTRWSSAFSDPQWLRVDLGATQTITGVRLHWEGAYGRDYRIEYSTNDNNWTSFYSTTSGDGGIDDITGLNTSGRYIRIYINQRATEWGNSLWEFEIYGSSGSSATVALTPTEDRDNAGSNGGSEAYVNASTYQTIYLKFNLSSVSSAITNAYLRLYRAWNDHGTSILTVYQVNNDSWSESNNSSLPPVGSQITTVSSSGTGWIEFSVTDFVRAQKNGDGIVTLAIRGSIVEWVQFHSRDNSSSKPQLVVISS